MGEGGWPKSRHSKGGCVDFILYFWPKCGQGGGGCKILLKLVQTSFMNGPTEYHVLSAAHCMLPYKRVGCCFRFDGKVEDVAVRMGVTDR